LAQALAILAQVKPISAVCGSIVPPCQGGGKSRIMSSAPVKEVIRKDSKPIMPVGFKASIPNAITALVIMSGCVLMVSLGSEINILGYNQWFDVVTWGGIPAFGVVTIFFGLLGDICDGMAARYLQVGTKFGSYFDELSDLTAFGIGPAVYFMRYCMDVGGSSLLVFIAGYFYMLASVYRISRELVIHRGKRPLFFVGVTTNMASCILAVSVFLFDCLGIVGWLPGLVFLLSATMVMPRKLCKDPTGLFISFEKQKRSMEEANVIEQAAIERQLSKPLMPVGLRALIPNLVTCIVILSGCILMTFASVLGLKPWAGVVVVFIGLLADILDGMTARKLKVGTKFGSFFDELADLTAFGIGPAVYFMRHGIDNGGSFLATRVVGYLYMLASVYRISRELVVHRGQRPLFFVGITTNMASLILTVLVFLFDSLAISAWLPIPVFLLSVLMVVPRKFYKDPSGLFIGFAEQKRSIEDADAAEKSEEGEKAISKKEE